MEKNQKQAAKTCADCIHESACRMWTDGRCISDVSASQCPNHETVQGSGAYLCGVLDERKRRQTNSDQIRSMSDEELAEFLNQWGTSTRAGQKDKGETMYWLQQPAEGE